MLVGSRPKERERANRPNTAGKLRPKLPASAAAMINLRHRSLLKQLLVPTSIVVAPSVAFASPAISESASSMSTIQAASWMVPALTCALLQSIADTCRAKVAKSGISSSQVERYLPEIVIAGEVVLMTPVALANLPTSVAWTFWSALALAACTIYGQQRFKVQALSKGTLSDAAAILAINPVITTLLAVPIEGKMPTAAGWAGVSLIALGLYLGSSSKEALQRGFFEPMRILWGNPVTKPMLIVSSLMAVGAHVSKGLVTNADNNIYFGVWLGAVAALTLALVSNPPQLRNHQKRQKFLQVLKHPAALGAGLAATLSNLLLAQAMVTGPAHFVTASKRTSLIWSTALGALLFKDPITRWKFIGFAVEIAGVALLTLA